MTTTTNYHPLLLSTLAGLSTSVGAAVAFCIRTPSDDLMSFALALAGSVMVTVSVVSLGPEILHNENNNSEPPYYIAVPSMVFVERCGAFALGSALFVVISKALPEPNMAFPTDSRSAQHEAAHDESVDIHNNANAPLIQPTSSLDTLDNDNGHDATTFMVRRRPAETAMTPGPALDDDHENIKSGHEVKATMAFLPQRCGGIRRHGRCFLLPRASGLPYSSDAAEEDDTHQGRRRHRAWRVTVLLFISLAAHNFPEGLAVAASTLHSNALGMTTAVAIALHNIPEGVAVAVPCLVARPQAPWLAFGLATLSGLTEPLGAAVALLVLDNNNATTTASSSSSSMHLNNVLAFVAGIMITVSVVELLPEAARHNRGRPWWAGLVAGVVLMVGSDMYLDS